MANWTVFPHEATLYNYSGNALESAWGKLHAGDRVEFPDTGWVNRQLAETPSAAPKDFDGDVVALAARIQDAWRDYHAGRFEQAWSSSVHCGILSHAPANKASGIYATYLEQDERKRQACFLDAARQAEQAISMFPNDPNGHYFLAFNLGRYTQSISVVEALRKGIGGKIHDSLTRALELEPEHAEAHTAFGMYHAEIIDKVGKLIGGMTYGASEDKAIRHFERALELTPESPIAHIEYGNGLYLLFGDRKLDEVTDLYVRATQLGPRDAMEKLDIEAALSELE